MSNHLFVHVLLICIYLHFYGYKLADIRLPQKITSVKLNKKIRRKIK